MKSTFLILSILSLISCKQSESPIPKKEVVRNKPKSVSYKMENAKTWLKEYATETTKLEIVTAINRTDAKNLAKMDSIIIPTDFSGDKVFYLPFPLEVESLNEVSKILIFSYPTQTFAAYENGILTSKIN